MKRLRLLRERTNTKPWRAIRGTEMEERTKMKRRRSEAAIFLSELPAILAISTAGWDWETSGKKFSGTEGRSIADADLIEIARNIQGMNPETTLVVVVSKSFRTAETMLNARALKEWVSETLGPQAVQKHILAVMPTLSL